MSLIGERLGYRREWQGNFFFHIYYSIVTIEVGE
jgi:hypothetical protein